MVDRRPGSAIAAGLKSVFPCLPPQPRLVPSAKSRITWCHVCSRSEVEPEPGEAKLLSTDANYPTTEITRCYVRARRYPF